LLNQIAPTGAVQGERYPDFNLVHIDRWALDSMSPLELSVDGTEMVWENFDFR
jgi:hypothetical protein